MSTQKKGLTTQGMNLWLALHIVLAVAMIASGLYLTRHYYDVHFSLDLTKTGLCSISEFFNCDVATHSKAATLFHVPTSIFGLMVGFFFLLGSIFPSPDMERTNSLVSKINVVGCVGLFLYSLVILKSLCPVCGLYYLFSIVIALLYWMKGLNQMPSSLKFFLLQGVLMLLVAVPFGLNVKDKWSKQTTQNEALRKSAVEQFDKLPKLGTPDLDSPYKIHQATPQFTDAAIQVSVYSDFECPYCAKLSPMLHDFAKKYPNDINIQYFFYPLDSSCNPEMKGQLHALACKASYLAACSGERFVEIHDEIFNNQSSMDVEWLDRTINRLGVSECVQDPKTKELVVKMIESGKKFNVKSTPTMIINGVKIDGVLPTPMFYAIFDELVKRKAK